VNGGLSRLNLPDYLIDRVAQIHLSALPGQLRKPPLLRPITGPAYRFVEAPVQAQEVGANTVELVDEDQEALVQLH